MVQILTKMLNRVSPSLNIHLRAKKYKAINNNFPLKLDHVLNDVLANGYAVLPEFFSEEWCQACVEQIDDFIEKVPQYVHKGEDERLFGAHKATRLTQDTIKPLLESDPERLKTFEAKKGSVILVDTSGIHRGAPVQDGERYALFNYYMPESEYDKDRIETKFSPVVPENYEEV